MDANSLMETPPTSNEPALDPTQSSARSQYSKGPDWSLDAPDHSIDQVPSTKQSKSPGATRVTYWWYGKGSDGTDGWYIFGNIARHNDGTEFSIHLKYKKGDAAYPGKPIGSSVETNGSLADLRKMVESVRDCISNHAEVIAITNEFLRTCHKDSDIPDHPDYIEKHGARI